MISKTSLEKFKTIYKEEFGEELSDQEAMEKATKFLNLMKVIMKPIPKDTVNLGNEENGGNL